MGTPRCSWEGMVPTWLVSEIDAEAEAGYARRGKSERGRFARLYGAIEEIVSGGKGGEVAAQVMGGIGAETEDSCEAESWLASSSNW